MVISEKAKFKGRLETPGTLIVLGSFIGGVEAESVSIAGYFEGEIACYGHLTIVKTATVKGRIAYGSLSVETGGLLDAEVFQLESMDKKLIPFHPPKGKSKRYKKKSSKK